MEPSNRSHPIFQNGPRCRHINIFFDPWISQRSAECNIKKANFAANLSSTKIASLEKIQKNSINARAPCQYRSGNPENSHVPFWMTIKVIGGTLSTPAPPNETPFWCASWFKSSEDVRTRRLDCMRLSWITCALPSEKYGAVQPYIKMLNTLVRSVTNNCARQNLQF